MEKIISILENKKFGLPIKSYDDDFHLCLKKLFKSYVKELKESLNINYRILNIKTMEDVDKLVGALLATIIKYYHGLRQDAYFEFEKAMRIVNDYLILDNVKSVELKQLYRIRYGDNNLYNKEDMFHIPFHNRGKIKSQRYSIPGFPALYLGSSSYICWDEMRRPDFQNVHISMFSIDLDSKLSILDIGLRPNDVVKKYKESSQEDLSYNQTLLENYIFMWPLIASCSVRVRSDQDSFKPEYIIPQFLLEWMRKNKNISVE